MNFFKSKLYRFKFAIKSPLYYTKYQAFCQVGHPLSCFSKICFEDKKSVNLFQLYSFYVKIEGMGQFNTDEREIQAFLKQ